MNTMREDKVPPDDEVLARCLSAASRAIQTIENYASHDLTKGLQGPSIYTGVGGLSLMYLAIGDIVSQIPVGSPKEALLHRFLPGLTAQHCVAKADTWLSILEKRMRFSKSRVTFLEGSSGALALRVVAAAQAGRMEEAEAARRKLEGMAQEVAAMPAGECELLYGRAGYLWSLAFLERLRGPGAVASGLCRDVMDQILSAGEQMDELEAEGGAAEGGNVAVEALATFGHHWQWHGSVYLGAIHGYAGIALALLQAGSEVGWDSLGFLEDQSPADPRQAARRILGGLISTISKTGNLPSSLGSINDKLVQICHGAPGLLLLLSHMLPSLTNLTRPTLEEGHKALVAAADCVWSRGLLTKGVGLCHGISGNGLALLSAWRATKSQRMLDRAKLFALFAAESWERLLNVPDNPLSLYEGLAGCVVFWMSMLAPERSHFPGLELPPPINQANLRMTAGFQSVRHGASPSVPSSSLSPSASANARSSRTSQPMESHKA